MKYSNQNPQIKRQKIITSTIEKSNLSAEENLHSLPLQRPLLLIGHGTKDAEGKQNFLDFVTAYQNLDKSRPVIPCFLELTKPTIQEGVDKCVEQGYTELSALPILLFAARHNKFDITNELDRARQRHPQIKFYYGRNFGITPKIIELWRSRLKELDETNFNCSETVLLFVGRGSSDPDANGDVYKLSRMLWEGTGYLTVETCFIGITHPRLEEGFRRARLYQPKRILVLPYFLFTGVLVKKIFDITAQQQEKYPHISMTCLPEMGSHPKLLELLREREVETQSGEVKMNCEMCKFRLVTVTNREHSHGHYNHHHDHSHLRNIPEHSHSLVDPYSEPEQYHQRIWQVP